MTSGRRELRTIRRDAIIAIVLAVAVAVLLFAARAGGRDPGRTAVGSDRTAVGSAPPGRPADSLPPGWHEVARSLTDVTLPVQVFAAATYPIVLHPRPSSCGPPRSVLAAMPPGGVLLQVIEYPARAAAGDRLNVPRLPRRPDRFTWADADWARFECAGPSYKFDYRQEGRALQAQVWMRRDTVDPRLRAGALRILDNFR